MALFLAPKLYISKYFNNYQTAYSNIVIGAKISVREHIFKFLENIIKQLLRYLKFEILAFLVYFGMRRSLINYVIKGLQGGNMNGSDAHPASMVNKIIWSCYVTLDSLISSPVLAGWASDPFMLPPCIPRQGRDIRAAFIASAS